MIDQLKALAEENGIKLTVVSVDKIKILENELMGFQKTAELNWIHKWVINKMYHFKIPESMKSIIIVAVPHFASYANITFVKNKKNMRCMELSAAIR